MTRSFVSTATVVAIAGGSLLGTGAGFAAAAPATAPSANTRSVGILATQNFGLTSAQAQKVQRWLATCWNTNDGNDGRLGTNSGKAFQRRLATYHDHNGAINGDPGSGTISALQRLLRSYGCTGASDGIVGSGTRAAFREFANSR
ncbi:peptidoglycan-binding protein [Streptomyces sp. ADMS]|uniref:peptidoglycan-binding domain-containing protein n=1 Tax=Streptomyces sp. ADMS TaxID=3071415 RepID=UPI00296EE589|nr:peptidoglycan-binding protein [Streptomyces sp. ADMS]MDW4905840.1 peptidoglycan-binding protein [Streptomyces sp. ADMS]